MTRREEQMNNHAKSPRVRPAAHTQPPPWRLDLFITLLGLCSPVLFLAFYDRAFPSAAIDLELSRAEITQRAQTYLESQGHALDDYEGET